MTMPCVGQSGVINALKNITHHDWVHNTLIWAKGIIHDVLKLMSPDIYKVELPSGASIP